MKTLPLFAVLALAACTATAPAPVSQPVTTSPSAGGLHFGAERIGPATVRLTLDNGTPARVGYNLCLSELQRLSGSEWTRVETGEVCTMQLMTLGPGHDATFEKTLPAGLASGTYRYVAGFESPLGAPQTRVATAPFSQATERQ